jgi:hypothetical protein
MIHLHFSMARYFIYWIRKVIDGQNKKQKAKNNRGHQRQLALGPQHDPGEKEA